MEEISLVSRIVSVHVHRDGAVVTRAGELVIPKANGDVRVRASGLPLALDDTSLRLAVEGAARALDVRVALESTQSAVDVPVDERERLRLVREETRLDCVLLHLDRVRAMVERTAVYRRPPATEGVPPIELDVAARLSLLDFRVVEMERLAEERRKIAREQEVVRAKRAEIERAIEKREGARAPKPDELRKAAVFTLRPLEAEKSLRIEVAYAVPGARWAPAYALHLREGAARARVEVRALVSQETGEDWKGVALAVSSAPIARPCDLPELHAIRIGRQQSAAPKRSWRRPPDDVEALFDDYQRALRRAPPPRQAPPSPGAPARPTSTASVSLESTEIPGDERTPPVQRISDLAGAIPATRMPMPLAPPPSAAPERTIMRARSAGPPAAKGGFALFGGGGAPPALDEGALSEEAPLRAPVVSIEPDDALLSFGSLRLPAAASSAGKLRIARRDELWLDASKSLDASVARSILPWVEAARGRAAAIARRPLPPRLVAPAPLDGFDAIYEAEGPADVPADGDPHSVSLISDEGACATRHVSVPRETQDVFRMAEIESPFEVPLLPGPCDVYLGGKYFLAIDLEGVAPRAKIVAGLGVDQAVKIARNTTFAEQATGLMGGALQLRHRIEIDVVNHRSGPIDLEVRERVPVAASDEEDVKVEVGEVKPAWKAWEPPAGDEPIPGAHAWRIRVAAGGETTLVAAYAVKIPAKLEIVGGNRREG